MVTKVRFRGDVPRGGGGGGRRTTARSAAARAVDRRSDGVAGGSSANTLPVVTSEVRPELLRAHLTAADERFIRSVLGAEVDPATALDDPRLADAVLGPVSGPGTVPSPGLEALASGVSPFLLFWSTLVRTGAELGERTWVPEWVGPRQRLPVFTGSELRRLAGDRAVRWFCARLLASYTHVVGGSRWVRTPRGWRRRRFSELDPVSMAELAATAPPELTPGILRRLGDLALLLTGVFPDHTATALFGPVQVERLGRLTGTGAEELAERLATGGGVALLEHLGPRWYRAAVAAAPVTDDDLRLVAEVADRFGDVRRLLNVVTDRWLFPIRDRLFGAPGA